TVKQFLLLSMLALGLVAGLMSLSPLFGQERPRQELPRAQDILDHQVKAVGEKDAYQKIKSVVKITKISGPEGQVGVVVYNVGPTKHYEEVSNDGIGKVEFVVNGDAAWENHSITGARFLQGAEKAGLLRAVAEFSQVIRSVGNSRTEYKEVRT